MRAKIIQKEVEGEDLKIEINETFWVSSAEYEEFINELNKIEAKYRI